MPTVIIIGFKYSKTVLYSTIIDIYIVYSYYRNLGYKIYIATDIVDLNDYDMLELYTSGVIDDKYQDFKDNFRTLSNLVNDGEELDDFFMNIKLTSDRRLLVYYTGHGKKDHIVLPNGKYHILDFRSKIIGISEELDSIGSQIFLIMDCCHPHGMYLPFLYNRETSKYVMISNHYVLPEIILIVSSEEDSKSRATYSGSFFTRQLFKLLEDKRQIYNFKHIILTMDTNLDRQKCIVRASSPTLNMPWSWVVTNTVDFRIDDIFRSVFIRQSIK